MTYALSTIKGRGNVPVNQVLAPTRIIVSVVLPPLGNAGTTTLPEQYFSEAVRIEEKIRVDQLSKDERKRLREREIDLWTQVIENRSSPEPLKGQALVERAKRYSESHRCEQAIEDVNAFLRDGSNADAYQVRGQCYSIGGQYREAVSDYTSALALGATNPFIYESRGSANYELGEYSKAVEDFSVFLKVLPSFNVYEKRGDAYSFLEKYELAREDYAKALEDYVEATKGRAVEDSDSVQLRSKIARTYLSERNVKPAIDIYKKLIAEFPRNYEGYLGLAEAYLVGEDRRDLNSAIEAATKAVSLSRGNDAYAFAALAEARFRSGNVQGAVEVLERAVKLEPENQQFQDSMREYRQAK